jgi:hypothetical protein
MQKTKPFKMLITKNQLIQVAVQSIHTRGNLSQYWEYVHGCQQSGLTQMTDQEAKNLLTTREALVYGLAFDLDEAESKLSSSVQYKDVIPNRSGMIEITGTVENLEEARAATALKAGKASKDPAAEKKSKALVTDVAQRYGWSATGINQAGDPTIFHHWELDLHVYAYSRPLLQATGSDGIKHPCLQYESYIRGTSYKGDAVAALLVTCVSDPVMAAHIEKFCPGFIVRWSRYQEKLKRQLNG